MNEPGGRLLEATATERVLIDLAGTVVEFRSGEAAAAEQVRRRFAAFLGKDKNSDIEVVHTRCENEFQGGFGTQIDVGRRRVLLRGKAGLAQLDGALRAVLPIVASPDLIVHAALLADAGRGLLCCGKPGAGKSTLAGLFPEAALCDELARLHLSSTAIEGRSLPFWLGNNRRVDVSRVFFLHHGENNTSVPLTVSETLRELRRHLYWPLDDRDATAGAFSSLAEFARRVPGYRLGFLPDRSVWAALTEVA